MTTNRSLATQYGLRVLLLVAVAAVSGGAAYALLEPSSPPATPAAVTVSPEPPEASPEDVRRLCGACHAYPPADTFPRSAWRREVTQGYNFFHQDVSHRFPYPPLESAVRYYENRAPEALPTLPPTVEARPMLARFERSAEIAPPADGPPGVAHVDLVHLFRKDRLDILACDVINKRVLVLKPYESPPVWRTIAQGFAAVHAEVVDLDGDGINDVVLAVIGNFYATDERVGSVVWLKGSANGTFTPITLLDGLGRVADVRAADFRGTGKPDLVVAEFGLFQSGSILLLENHTTDWSKPTFVPTTLDPRHGTTHVPVADLNGDGRPDFVAVISQEHETVVAFLNEGGGRFRKETIFTAPHPSFGCNGVQLVDLNGDGKLDVLLTNGDSLDPPPILKPFHGLTWLENKGRFPFEPHRLADCYGAGSPVAADFDGNGLLDIAFVTFLPADSFPKRGALRLDAVALLEQVEPGKFVRHTLEVEACDHLTCAAGDVDGDGRPDLVVGNYIRGGKPGAGVTVWRNATGKRVAKP
jgi:hypothetical protein